MSSQSTTRHPDSPQPGFYRMRLVRRGAWVTARIHRMPDGRWQAEIDGELLGWPSEDWIHAEGLDRIWPTAQRITEADYSFALALKAWAQRHQPNHPCLHPTRPIDPAQLQPITS
jgi:hypothetical protein